MVIQPKSTSPSSRESSSKEESSVAESASLQSKSESAANVLNALNKRRNASQANGADSLDILRENIQFFFNGKINTLMKEFLQIFFEPAIKKIKENTNEIVTEQQMKKICRNLLESCVKSQYSSEINLSSPTCSSSCNTTDINTSDSDTSENGGTSLLHQALKRKRTDSETEQLFKRQFFLTTAPPNHYFNTSVTSVVSPSNTGKSNFRPTTPVITTSSKFEPKFITRPLQPSTGIFSQTGSTTRPIFHIIQAPNRQLKLSATHVELCQLLAQNTPSSSHQIPPTTENVKLLTTAAPDQNAKTKESESKK